MSNKTPPLVIPVVIDSSGVSQGLNNVNNRLRNGIAGGVPGTGGAGGFGSGGAGSVAASAIGAAVGAYGRSGSLGGGPTWSPYKVRGSANIRESIRNDRSGLGGGISTYGRLFDRFYENAVGRQGSFSSAHQIAHYVTAGREQIRAQRARANFKRGMLNAGYNVGRGVDALGEFGSQIPEAFKATRGALLSVLGAGYTAKKIYDLANNIGNAGADISNLVGSKNYGKMRNVALRQYDRGAEPSPLQAIMLGGMRMTGGRETALEKDAAAIRKGVSQGMSAFGMAYETFRNDPGYALLLAWQATPIGGLLSGLFGGSFKESVKTEIQYRNWKASQN